MKLVVDSNVLFSFFWKKSIFENVSAMPHVQLFTPEFALEEIREHREELQKKTKISRQGFSEILEELMQRVEFVPLKEYDSLFPKTKAIAKHLSDKEEFIKDIDFVSLALKLNCPLWSNDRLLKKQSQITVISTREIIELFG